MKETEKTNMQPSYWAVVPAGIRYDDRIPANAKLLYAEISALTGQEGYCWADNAYFAGLYKMSERTIRSLLKALEDQGYIRIEREAGEHNSTKARRIYAGINPLGGASASLENFCQTDPPVWKKISASLEENFQTHLLDNNNKLSRVRASGKQSRPRSAPDWKPERFEAFWTFYRRIPGEDGKSRNENKQAAMDAWDRLQPDDALIATIGKALLRQLATPAWKRGIGIPMAATYLNKARWTDAEDLPEPREDAAADPEEGGKIRWI